MKDILKDLGEVRSFFRGKKLGIVSHNDSDGIASAAIISSICNDGFQTRILEKFDLKSISDLAQSRDGLAILDMGGDRIEELSKIGKPILVLDHHPSSKREEGEVKVINPHFYGLDGAFDCCASTLAYYLAENTHSKEGGDKKNLVIALVGIMGDMQHLDIRGLNVGIFERADRDLSWEVCPVLNGDDLREALLNSVDPFVKGLSGDEDGVDRFLKGIGLDGGKRLDELSEKEMEKLNSALAMVMLKGRAKPEMVRRIISKRYRCELQGVRFVDELSRIVNGCGKSGSGGLAVTALLDEHHMRKVREIAGKRDAEMLRELNGLKLEDMGSIRFFWADHGSELSTLIANYLSSDKPVFGLSKNNDMVKISGRGSKEMVGRGLNLSSIMGNAKKFGGSGGGHSVAAGCIIPAGKEGEFLRSADESVKGQIE